MWMPAHEHGDEWCALLIDVLDAHQQLADEYRARGLTGHALDVAIVSNLPLRPAQLIDGVVYH
jgi:hypothetical protein